MRPGMPANAPVVLEIVNGLEVAGAETAAVALARGLAERGWDVRFLVVRDGPLRERFADGLVPLTVLGHDLVLRAPLALAGMVRYLRDVRPSIVHTHLIGMDVFGRTAAMLAGVPRIVSTQHDSLPRSWHLRAFRAATRSRVDATIACSSSVYEFARDEMRIAEERLHLIPNAVDVGRFAGAARPHEGLVIGALGNLRLVKGHDVLLRAFARVVDARPDARLVIAGEGEARAGLERLARELGVAGAVELPGAVGDVPGFLLGLDLFAHPSIAEGLPLALLEAMAAGLPVVASRLPAIAEALEGGACGRLVEPGDADALGTALLALADDPATAAGLAAAARARVAAAYSLDAHVNAHERLFRELLPEGGQ